MKLYSNPVFFTLLYCLCACGTKKELLDTTNEPIISVPITKEVPYFYQYGNTNNPSGSCQNTCVAMVLKYFAAVEGLNVDTVKNITPDNISKTWGTKKAQSVVGLQEVFNAEAVRIGVKARDIGTETMPLAQFRTVATNSKTPFIVHGYFTSFGHILVVLSFDGTNYICNDPAGKWSLQYKNGGYSTTNATEGMAIKYPKQAFEAAISPDSLVWVHSFK